MLQGDEKKPEKAWRYQSDDRFIMLIQGKPAIMLEDLSMDELRKIAFKLKVGQDIRKKETLIATIGQEGRQI